MTPFKDKVVIVTGGGAGIGRAICEALGREGAILIVADVNGTNAAKVADGIVCFGGRASATTVDVSREEDVAQMIEETAAAEGRIDYVFNNAGIAIGGDARDLTLEQWRRVMEVNWNGVLYGSVFAYKVMARQGFGHIVNTASATGILPQPGNAPYCASKHAVVGLSQSLRFEGVDLGVKVSVVCPGRVATDIYKSMTVINVDREKVLSNPKEPPISGMTAAKHILDGVRRNRDLIVFPVKVRWAWRLYRLFPQLLNGRWLASIRKLRRLRSA
jgi:NAD(P)-dependent dehydrogenase (short-subunit alcohol dehydrogenase family)